MSAPQIAPPGHLLLAPHHLRLFAFLLDYLIVVAGLKLAEQALLGQAWDLRLATETPPIFPLWWVSAAVGLFLVRDVAGASIGKWVMGISVRKLEHPFERAPPLRAVARNLSLLLLPADAVSIFRDPQMRRLGDRWFRTVVVVRDPELPIVRRAFGLGILFLGFVLTALLVTSWNVHRAAAYQVARHAIESRAALNEELGPPVVWDWSPAMDLRLDRGSALLAFQAQGTTGKSEVHVRLVLMRGPPPAWSVGSIDVTGPPHAPAPLVQDAPAAK